MDNETKTPGGLPGSATGGPEPSVEPGAAACPAPQEAKSGGSNAGPHQEHAGMRS